MAKRALISFDYDHDLALKNLLAGQAKYPDSTFELADWSVKEHMTGDWKEKVRQRIKRVDVVIVLCGKHTNTATGVSEELRIAREEGIPYFLLAGYSEGGNVKPVSALATDTLYSWTWDNLKKLINGAR